MGFLGKEQLLTKAELKVVKIEFENGDYVFVREMTGSERNTFENSIMVQQPDGKGGMQLVQKLDNFRAKLAVCTVCDEEGNLLFTTKDTVKLSESISASMLEKIITEAQKLNGISAEVKEDVVKN